jgi:segregation and condensation protein B
MLHASHALPRHHLSPPEGWRADSGSTSTFWNWLSRHHASAGIADATQTSQSVRSPKHARLEAALFSASGPLTPRRLMQFASLASIPEVRQLLRELDSMYEASGSAFRIEKLATGYRLYTRPEFASWLDRIHHRQTRLKLSPPMMETLTIIAYRQPITRADVEAVRGVQSAEIIKQLMERGLVRITGEDDSLGRPYLYGTTREFLEQFGIAGLDDLPNAEHLRPASPGDAAQEAAADATDAVDVEDRIPGWDDDDEDEEDEEDDDWDDDEAEDDDE